MNEVIVNSNGVLQNLLASNYDETHITCEYLNNTLKKNINSENYYVNFTFRDLYSNPREGSGNVFTFIEENSIGFSTLDDIKGAYQIAKSDRSGTNNMGNGIYSPLTLDKNNDTLHLFIQNNNNGQYYSVVYYDSVNIKLYSEQGVLNENNIFKVDVSDIIDTIKNGTISLWFNDKQKYYENLQFDSKFIQKIQKLFKSETNINLIDDKILGKRYIYYLNSTNISIFQGENKIDPINILEKPKINNIITQMNDNSGEIIEHIGKFKIAVSKNSENKDNYLVSYVDGDWKPLYSSGPGRKTPFKYDESFHMTRTIEANTQFATFTVYDFEYPNKYGGRRKEGEDGRINDRRIWVKVDNIYICDSEITLSPPNPNARFVLEFEDDNIDKFIALNANKSNSKINDNIMKRIQFLAKYQLKIWNNTEVKEKSVYNFNSLNAQSTVLLAKLLKIPYDEKLDNCKVKNKDIKDLSSKIMERINLSIQ